MKPRTLLINLRRLFGFGRYLVVILLLLGLVIPRVSLTFPDVWLEQAPPAPAAGQTSVATPTVRLTQLHGSMKIIKAGEPDADLQSLIHSTHIPFLVFVCLVLFGYFDTSWRLFRNAENGEVFTSQNVRLVRRLGWVSIGNAIVDIPVHLWTQYHIGRYIITHDALAGTGLVPASLGTYYWGIGSIVFGVALLVLAEVFAYGLELKEESELTV